MMNFSETSGSIIDGRIEFTVPLSKVDKEKRMVHGFATLDNIDLAGDIVPIESSLKAFKKFRGNMREMHDKLKAIGKIVSFRPERYYDPESQKVYNGVFVSAYVSKGAEDTWQKVLDGTLTGFSIGGVVTKTSDKIVEEGIYRVIEDYFLNELSLVDNPCNQFSTILSVEKNASDEGYLANTSAENVFWCRKDNKVQLTSAADTTCYHCDATMQNIGFVESADKDKMSVIKSLLADVNYVPVEGETVNFDEGFGVIEKVIPTGLVKLNTSDEDFTATENDPVAIVRLYVQKDDTMVAVNRRILKNVSSLSKTMKEVENVNNAETDVTVVEEVIVEKSVDPALGTPQVFAGEPADASAAPAVDAEKVEDGFVKPEETEAAKEEEVVEKAVAPVEDLSEIKAMLKSLTEALAPFAELVKSLGSTVKENSVAVEKVASDLASAKETIAAATNEFGERIDAVESKSAFQKSADLGEIRQEAPVKTAKTKWDGTFLDSAYFTN